MCEEISVCYKCGHSERFSLACIKETKSINEKEGESFALLGGMPALLPWCPIASHSTACKRLCPDCRRERRGEMRDSEAYVAGGHLKVFSSGWKAWKSKEGEEAREERKRQEAEIRRWRERLLEPEW
jgi:hypothetical protein